MNIRHTGACSERFLNDRSELHPLKQQYPLIFLIRKYYKKHRSFFLSYRAEALGAFKWHRTVDFKVSIIIPSLKDL